MLMRNAAKESSLQVVTKARVFEFATRLEGYAFRLHTLLGIFTYVCA